MSPEAQRIAIAESVGFYQEKPWLDGRECWGHKNFPTHCGFEEIPDYLNDLNAMHEAEERLPNSKKESYWDYLYENCQRSVFSSVDDNYKMIHATAAQRAEAYLRTEGRHWLTLKSLHPLAMLTICRS